MLSHINRNLSHKYQRVEHEVQTFFWDLQFGANSFDTKRKEYIHCNECHTYHTGFVNMYKIKKFKKEFPFQDEVSFYLVSVITVKETQMKINS